MSYVTLDIETAPRSDREQGNLGLSDIETVCSESPSFFLQDDSYRYERRRGIDGKTV